ncbi:MAG: acetylglutamate kinase [Planctomycetes bacterium]|nr:acetylglutamate kinase [Planctomycetota bacterium]
MAEPRFSAEAFASAVDRVCAHRGRPVVVKLGGSAMEDPAATDACLKSVATLHRLGVPVVLVHGGGKPIDRAMSEAGLVPKKVAGRRYTDDATLAIVVRVLEEINNDLVRRLDVLSSGAAEGGAWFGFPFDSTMYPIVGRRLLLHGLDAEPIELGRVGTVARVGTDLQNTLDKGVVPVLPSVAVSEEDGDWLNVNADTAASAVAGALKAEKAVFLTDTPGVLRDRSDPNSLVPKLTERECRDLIASGVIDGGMVPKVEACFEALDAGAGSALILDGRVPFSLLDVFLHDTFKGTAITR